jgi:hypothetical protein
MLHREATRRPAPHRRLRASLDATLLLVLALGILAFVGSTALTFARMREVSGRSEDEAAMAMPSVVDLAALRERVYELETALTAAIGEEGSPGAAMAGVLTDIEVQARVYEGHATLPGERELWVRASDAIDSTTRAAQLVLASLSGGDVASARAAFESDFRPAASLANEELWRMVALHARTGVRAARHIESVHRDATFRSLGLDAACVMLTAALVAFVLRATRRPMALVAAATPDPVPRVRRIARAREARREPLPDAAAE